MSHEHLCIDLASVRLHDDSTFDDSPLVITEVKKAMALGVKTMVEVTCNDMGRDAKKLKHIAELCDLHIVAATGFYLQEYHPAYLKQASVEDIAAIFIRDLTIGMEDTSIKAGVIGEVATSEVATLDERKVLQAASLAAQQVGCAITTHCQMGKLGKEQAELFLAMGMNPEKVVLGHIDLSNDSAYMRELMDFGFNIGFDTIGKECYLSDQKRLKTLCSLLQMGYGDRIVLSQDISKKSYFSNQDGYDGYTRVMKTFIPALKQMGVTQREIDHLLQYNPQRIFDIRE